jgi:hypothetical protein
MAARDHFSIELICPKCGAKGDAQVSEDDYPFTSSPRFQVDELPQGFKVFERAKTREKTLFGHECGGRFYG